MDACDFCARDSVTYSVDRVCCALRLILATPAHGARQAMWAHLAATMDGERFAELRAEAEAQGIIRSREAA